jgi:hypothetical protein
MVVLGAIKAAAAAQFPSAGVLRSKFLGKQAAIVLFAAGAGGK